MAKVGNRALNIAGHRYGRLVAIERGERVKGGYNWLCRCDCGSDVVAKVANLRNGHTQSCGCLARDIRYKHGGNGTPLHRRWIQLRSRCNNNLDRRWMDYGGRGITYAPEWDDFSVFAEWAKANGFRQELQIDRIDNDGPYSPENCRWVTARTNMNNTRRTRRFEFFGEELSIAEAARKFGVSDSTLTARLLEHGLTPEEAVTARGHDVRRIRQRRGLAPPSPKIPRGQSGQFKRKADL